MRRECLEAYRRFSALGKAVFQAPSDPLPEDVPQDLVHAILAARDAD